MNWIDLLAEIGVFAIIAGCATYLIKYSLDKRLKNYEIELNSKAENFKSELRLESYKQEKLHENRLLIISELYKRIARLDIYAREMTTLFKFGGKDFDEREKERIDRTGNAYNDLFTHYKEHEIYFNSETCELLNELTKEYYNTLFDYTYEKNYNAKNPKDYREIANHVTEELPKVLESLRKDFRSKLSV
ncbi:MAG: hypothetical protein WD607_00440 [Candidatus Paceibacterota bacterium]